MTRIKLCGLTREEDVATANELQPDYVGFVFWPRSRRCVSPETARLLKAQLDTRIAAVGVFVDAPADQVAGLLDDGTIDIAQLHGHEDDAYIAAVRSLLPEPAQKVLVKAFVVKDAADLHAASQSSADMVLLDAGLGGGTPFDWSLLEQFERPYFLAGGLDADNVAEALALTGAAAVDTSSGIETDGVKDPAKMRAFVQAVRAWDAENRQASQSTYTRSRA